MAALADALRQFGAAYLATHALSTPQAKAWRAIVACRTAAHLFDRTQHGGHVWKEVEEEEVEKEEGVGAPDEDREVRVNK